VRLSCAIASFVALLAGCSAGPAEVETESAPDAGLVRFEFSTEGKNAFTVVGHSCEAEEGGGCVLEVPTAELQGGWNEIEVETRRRTGQKEALRAIFFLGDEAFARDCDVTGSSDSGDPDELTFDLECRFEEGFHGELFGELLQDGRTTVRAVDIPVEEDAGGVERPAARVGLPLFVVNRAGGRWKRPVDVVVPLQLVQLEIQGVRPVLYEQELPLRFRAEEGATVFVNGRQVGEAGRSGRLETRVPIEAGANEVTVEARLEGRVPAVHELSIHGAWPDTPLYIDLPLKDEFATQERAVVVRGTTSPQARLYLSNRPVDFAADGSFELLVPLEEGDNEVEVMAVVDPEPGVRRRPPTKRTFRIHCSPRAVGEIERYLSRVPEEEIDQTLAGLGRDPWLHVGERVRFALVVEEAATSLVDGGCSSRVAGIACTREVTRPVRVAFERRTARACAGEELPAVVELDSCPDLSAGDRVEVVGEVLGGLGGRHGEYTVERPRIAASWIEPAPWLVEPPAEGP